MTFAGGDSDSELIGLSCGDVFLVVPTAIISSRPT